jgi:hypothetical protein
MRNQRCNHISSRKEFFKGPEAHFMIGCVLFLLLLIANSVRFSELNKSHRYSRLSARCLVVCFPSNAPLSTIIFVHELIQTHELK